MVYEYNGAANAMTEFLGFLFCGSSAWCSVEALSNSGGIIQYIVFMVLPIQVCLKVTEEYGKK